MDQERERIQADLRGLLDGEVRCDAAFVQLYATDGSIYEIQPLGIVRPRNVADVVATLEYAAENQIPIHARGAGTSSAGESLGRGLVMDFSHSMRRMIRCDEEMVRVQAGVVCSQLNRFLAGRGRIFGPDPATSAVSTIGSAIALNASGSHWLRYGTASDNIVSMQVVLADGTVCEVGRNTITEQFSPDGSEGRVQQLLQDLTSILEKSSELIDQQTPKTCVNQSGYQLRGAWQQGAVNLVRLLAGSEGTLALVTEATLRTDPLPKALGVALLFFDRLESAARGALEIAGLGASACELLDRRLLSIAREQDIRFDRLIPRDGEAMLLVELQGDDQDDVRRRLQRMVVQLQRQRRLAFDSRMALEKDEASVYWQLVDRAVHGLYRIKGAGRPLPFVEGIAVPPESLPEFLLQMQNVFKLHQVTASLFAHAGQGQLHVRPFIDLGNPASVAKMSDVAEDLYEQVLKVGGTICGERGDGLSRSWFVRRQYGPLFPVFRDIKRAFDPGNILNPGKVAADAPQTLTENLRRVVPHDVNRVADRPATGSHAKNEPGGQTIDLQLGWDEASVIATSHACNGCGVCRTQLPDERMCPIFRYAPREEATPRAKANLMRAVFTGQLDPTRLADDDLKKLADLCVHCHQCRFECPAQVDIPSLMVECKSQYILTNGLRPVEWCTARIDWLSSWGSFFHPFTNWAVENRQARWVLERVLGIAQGRKLPRFAAKSFLRLAHRRRLTRPTTRSDHKVVFFVDVFANWHDVELAQALVAVFEHNGVSVYVPPGQVQSGMAAVSIGAVDVAKRLAQKNVRLLADAVRQGYHVVTNEPSAALCLSHEYPRLLDDDDARLVAENTSDACDYLWRRHQAGRLELDMKPVEAHFGYHLPCHLRALEVGVPGYQLLQLVPGLTIQHLHQACSGMAGTFGLWRGNYRTSLRAGWGLIASLRDAAIQLGATECSACKMQMEQGTNKPTIHPLKILALSYGVMPELATLLTQRGRDMVVT